MADVSWIDTVRKSGVLTVDASKVTSPGWKLATAAAIKELNAQFTSNSANVQLKTGDSAVVFVALSSGKYTFTVDGTDQTGSLRADILHGATEGIDRQSFKIVNREQAFIFLPEHPRVTPKNPKSREVGEPVMRVIVAHEFLHALGLVKHDPAFEGLLTESWTLNEGSTGKDDTVTPFGGAAKFPPLVLSSDTWTRLKKIW